MAAPESSITTGFSNATTTDASVMTIADDDLSTSAYPPPPEFPPPLKGSQAPGSVIVEPSNALDSSNVTDSFACANSSGAAGTAGAPVDLEEFSFKDPATADPAMSFLDPDFFELSDSDVSETIVRRQNERRLRREAILRTLGNSATDDDGEGVDEGEGVEMTVRGLLTTRSALTTTGIIIVVRPTLVPYGPRNRSVLF